MKVIDLLNKIANGEIKDKTKFRIEFKNGLYRDFYYDKEEKEEINCLKNISDDYSLYDEFSLNDEVEVIEDTPKEDKKIKKIKDYATMTTMGLDGKLQERKISKDFTLEEIVNKINEIIDRLNGDE